LEISWGVFIGWVRWFECWMAWLVVDWWPAVGWWSMFEWWIIARIRDWGWFDIRVRSDDWREIIENW